MWSVTPGSGLLSRFRKQGGRKETPEQEAELLRQGKLKPEDIGEDRRTWDWEAAPIVVQDPFWPKEVRRSLYSILVYRSKILKLIF
jgi:hypothetical protein